MRSFAAELLLDVQMDTTELLEAALPGANLVARGLDDLRQGIETIEALLVAIGRPRLVRLGFEVPIRYEEPEVRLYERLAEEHPDSAHSRYTALVRRLVSFERSAERAQADPGHPRELLGSRSADGDRQYPLQG